MKKILSVILCFMLAFALVGCNRGASDQEKLTMGETLKKEFISLVENGAKEPLEIAQKLTENEIIQFSPMVMEIEEGFLNGFSSEEIQGFDKGAVFSPMIGSIPFIGYIFEISEETNKEDFMKMLETQGDLNWNICVSADEMHIDESGDLVFFLMSPLSMEEEIVE